MDNQAVFEFLNARRAGQGWLAKCPAHEDRVKSLGIYERGGRLWFKCYAGCSHKTVAEVIGYDGRERVNEEKTVKLVVPKPNRAKIDAWWAKSRTFDKKWAEYRGITPEVAEAYGAGFVQGKQHGAWCFFVTHKGVRVAVKAHLEGEGRKAKALWMDCGGQEHGFSWLYPEPDAHKIVFLCPGELKALAILSAIEHCGIVAQAVSVTCGESGAMKREAAMLLSGKDVIIVQDQDGPGRAWAETIAAQLGFIADTVQIQEFPQGPHQGKVDANDYARKNGLPATGAILSAWIEALPKKRSIMDILTDRQRLLASRPEIASPWPSLELARPFIPGTTTVLCGAQSAAKSFAMLQMAMGFFSQGQKPAILMLEDDLAYHLRRALAQFAGEGRLTNAAYCKEHEGDWMYWLERFSREQAGFQDCISVLPLDVSPTVGVLRDWAEMQLQRGAQVLMIDPVTKMAKGKDGYVDDERFMAWACKLSVEKMFPLIVSTHPKKGAMLSKLRAGTLDDKLDSIAGKADYSRFAQSVLWLWRHDDEESCVDLGGGVGEVRKHNRTLEICKSRNTNYTGRSIALDFDCHACILKDLGIKAIKRD